MRRIEAHWRPKKKGTQKRCDSIRTSTDGCFTLVLIASEMAIEGGLVQEEKIILTHRLPSSKEKKKIARRLDESNAMTSTTVHHPHFPCTYKHMFCASPPPFASFSSFAFFQARRKVHTKNTQTQEKVFLNFNFREKKALDIYMHTYRYIYIYI